MAKTNKKPKKKVEYQANFQRNRKIVIISAAILTFAVIGLLVLRNSSAATQYSVGSLGTGCNSTPQLSVGSRGNCVSALQKGLNNWTSAQIAKSGSGKNAANSSAGGYIGVSGNFDEATKNKVMAFQKAKGQEGKNLKVDGIVGPQTWAAFTFDCSVFNQCGGK